MSKKKKIFALNDEIVCPYCNRRGNVVRVIDMDEDGKAYDVSHKFEWVKIKSAATGIFVDCECLTDGCFHGEYVVRDGKRSAAQKWEAVDLDDTEETEVAL